MKELIKRYDQAHDELKRRFPTGQRVEFTFMHGQVNASTGTIVGRTIRFYRGFSETSAYVLITIEHDQAKKGSRYPCRTVSPENILKFL